ILMTIEFNILSFLCDVIDFFDKAVKTLLKLNFFDYLSDEFSLSQMQTIILSIMSLALVFGACALVIFRNKIKVSDFLMSILVATILLVAFPAFISSCNSLRSKGITTAQSIKINDQFEQANVNSDGTVAIGTLGKDLLASGIYDVENSVDLKKKMNCLDTLGSSENIKNINITGAIKVDDDKPWTTYYLTDINDVYPVQTKYDELTTENMMSLLGFEDEYNILKNANGELILSADYGANMQVYCSVYSTSGSIYGSVLSEKDYETFLSASIGDACPYGATLGDLHYPDGSRITNVINYNTYLRDLIANHPAVAAAGKTQEVGANAHTVEEALDMIKDDVIRELNIAANTETAKIAEPVNATYQPQPLFNEDDYNELNSIEKSIRKYVTVGYAWDSLYYYHIDFWSTLVLMIAVTICLIFSGIKIATTLFEIMFSQLITPFIIATDLNGSGRAKKAIQNMLLSNIILMIVVILLRIYIAVIWGVKSSDYGDNFAVMLIVIIAGAKFVIDGPEILTKLFGIDAGVKSGAATMMAINQSMQMGSYATMGLARAGSSVVHGAGSVAKHTASSAAGAVKGFAGGVYGGIHGGDTTPGKIGKAIGGAAAGTVTGAVGGAFGHTNAGAKAAYAVTNPGSIKDTFSNAKDNIANNVKESVGEGFSSGGAGSASKGADGKDGLNGTNGMNGAKGDRGAQGAAGKDGTNGTDTRANNNENSSNNRNNNGTSQPARGSGFNVPTSSGENSNNATSKSGNGLNIPNPASRNTASAGNGGSCSDAPKPTNSSNSSEPNNNSGSGFNKEGEN
uniref:hypothetical protein n=1 Tax=Ruminococcus sp. TaxID=41978 RepID=UPI00257D313C